eukprot:190129-Chlamydomonas_euryale.AAC.1
MNLVTGLLMAPEARRIHVFTLEPRPKQPADRLLCLAIVTRHHLLLRTRLLRALRPGVAHGATFGARLWAAVEVVSQLRKPTPGGGLG